MARSQQRSATPNEELLLWWYFARNLKSIRVRKDPNLFQRMLNQQRKVREFLGWGYRAQTDDERYQELLEEFNGFAERFAFDGDLGRSAPPEEDM